MTSRVFRRSNSAAIRRPTVSCWVPSARSDPSIGTRLLCAADPLERARSDRSTARRCRDRTAIPPRLSCRGPGPRRATHMACPTRTRPVSQGDSGSDRSRSSSSSRNTPRQETLGPDQGRRQMARSGCCRCGADRHRLRVRWCSVCCGWCRTSSARPFRGSWMSTAAVPVIAFVASLAVMGLAAWRISKKKSLQKGSRLMAQHQRITRDDLESRFRQLQENVQGRRRRQEERRWPRSAWSEASCSCC